MNTRNTLAFRPLVQAALAGCLLGLTPCALAQGADAPKTTDQAATPKADDATPSDATERDALRERLTRQLDFIRDRERTLQSALSMLDDGKPLDDVREAAAVNRGDVADRFRERMGGGMGDDRPRRRGPNADQGPRADRPPLGPDDIPRIMDFIERHNPELAKDLRELGEKDPEAFQAKLAELAPRVQGMMERFKDRPERFQAMLKFREIDQRAHQLAHDIADTPPNASDLTLQLRQAVSEGFELRVQLGKLEIQDLQNRIDGLQKRTQHWAENKDSMIDGRVKELIEAAKSGEPPPPPGEGFGDDFGPGRGPRRGPPNGPPPN